MLRLAQPRKAAEVAVTNLFARLNLPDPFRLRHALSRSGLGRSAATSHDGHGDGARIDIETSPPEILKAEGLTVFYDGVPALSNASFLVRAGQTVAVVGESGSGKTTLGPLIAGLQPKASGDSRWHGMKLPLDYKARRKEELRKIQLIYQMPDTALNPKHRIKEILARVFSFYFGCDAQERDRRSREQKRA